MLIIFEAYMNFRSHFRQASVHRGGKWEDPQDVAFMQKSFTLSFQTAGSNFHTAKTQSAVKKKKIQKLAFKKHEL